MKGRRWERYGWQIANLRAERLEAEAVQNRSTSSHINYTNTPSPAQAHDEQHGAGGHAGSSLSAPDATGRRWLPGDGSFSDPPVLANGGVEPVFNLRALTAVRRLLRVPTMFFYLSKKVSFSWRPPSRRLHSCSPPVPRILPGLLAAARQLLHLPVTYLLSQVSEPR